MSQLLGCLVGMREDLLEVSWAGLLSLHSDPHRSNSGKESSSRPPPCRLCVLGSGLAQGPALPTPLMAFVTGSPCLGSASPMAPALRGSEIREEVRPSTQHTQQRLQATLEDRWASVFPLPGKRINKDPTWDFPQHILRTISP